MVSDVLLVSMVYMVSMMLVHGVSSVGLHGDHRFVYVVSVYACLCGVCECVCISVNVVLLFWDTCCRSLSWYSTTNLPGKSLITVEIINHSKIM